MSVLPSTAKPTSIGTIAFRTISSKQQWLDKDDDDAPDAQSVSLLSMAMITVGNGADNVGVYIPLFTGFSGAERIGAVIVFAVMTALWVFLANALAEFRKVKAAIGKYKYFVIPTVFILLGVYIIMDSGLLE